MLEVTKRAAGFGEKVVQVLVIMASLEITLLRYVNRWPLMVIWGGLYTASGESSSG